MLKVMVKQCKRKKPSLALAQQRACVLHSEQEWKLTCEAAHKMHRANHCSNKWQIFKSCYMKWLDHPHSRQITIVNICFLSRSHCAPLGTALWEYPEVTFTFFTNTKQIRSVERRSREERIFLLKLWSHYHLMSLWQFLIGEYQHFIGKSSI